MLLAPAASRGDLAWESGRLWVDPDHVVPGGSCVDDQVQPCLCLARKGDGCMPMMCKAAW